MRGICQSENDAVIEVIIESIAESVGEDFDYSELVERLNFYRKNPIDINRTEREQLQELMFLSPLQVAQILEYRNQNGAFLELYELQSVAALDLETIKKLLPFITIKDRDAWRSMTLKSLLRDGSNDVIFTSGRVLQQQSGYAQSSEKSHYLGSPYRFLSRYRYHYGNNLSAAITFEKDAGESFFNAGLTGFDYYSISAFYRGNNWLRKLAVGDYSLQFGQGLGLWSGMSFGKGAAVAAVARNEVGLKQYTSTNEALFFRGLAATLKFKRIELTPFVSYRKLDASLTDTVDEEASQISAVSETGLHRTAAELSNRNSTDQLIYGVVSQYSDKAVSFGITSYQTQFGRSFEEGDQPYNASDFSGDRLTNFSGFYNYAWRGAYLFGEAAHSLQSGSAFVNGAMASLTSRLSLILLYRNYQKNYHSFFNEAVAEAGNGVNEKGFYTGLIYTPSRKYEFSSYVDFFRFPWMRFRVDAPSSGYEILSQFSYLPSKRFKAMVRYRIENKEENDNLDNVINYLETVRKQNFRLEFSCKLNDKFQVRSRAEVVDYQKGEQIPERGFLLFQDLSYHPMMARVSGNIRVALFDAQSFNARIYAYESDVLYSFSAPAYQNRGLRFYANVRLRMRKDLDLWCRYAITSYSGLQEIGSGLDRIEGNNKSDFKLQLRFQF